MFFVYIAQNKTRMDRVYPLLCLKSSNRYLVRHARVWLMYPRLCILSTFLYLKIVLWRLVQKVPKIFYTRLLIVISVCLTLPACGRKGALEAPPGDLTPRVEARRNTFFNTNAKIEEAEDGFDPETSPKNPQLTAAGQVVRATEKTGASSDKGIGVAPVGGGRKGKRILPPQKNFILDPLL